MGRWGATAIFDLYWQFAVDRQQVLIRRLAGASPPWTDDPIIAQYRFTNPYRFSDRVSQHLLRSVQHDQPRRTPTNIVFRTLLFRVFNRIDTWDSLVAAVGEPTIESFDPVRYGRVLAELRGFGQRIYSPAYIVPNPPFGAPAKHQNHLRMLGSMLDDGTIDRLITAGDLGALYQILRTVPSLGPFLAFQYAVDLNYSNITDTGEDSFVVPGPGEQRGLRKCFSTLPAGAETDAILWVAETQVEHFDRLNIKFCYLAGRPLQPIDIQNLFCEIDKYTRASHPHLTDHSNRVRIKQGFDPARRQPLPPLFIPPKWQPYSPRKSPHPTAHAKSPARNTQAASPPLPITIR